MGEPERMTTGSGGRSIRRRLMLSSMITAGLALLLASSAYFAIEVYQLRGVMVENLSVLARLIGANATASMLFDDVDDAEKTLATLEEQDHILAAALYDDSGRVFAHYLRGDASLDTLPSQIGTGHAFGAGALDLYEPLRAEGEELGTVFIRSDTVVLSRLLWSFLSVFLIATAASLAICYIGASLLRRSIAAPLEALLESSEAMASGDLSTRVEVQTQDELGTLAGAFDAMVASLSGLVSQVRTNADAVASVSVRLQDTSEAMCSDAKRQEIAVDETTSSIESIPASIREVSANVDTLSHTAAETSTASMQMDESIGQIAGHMDGLSETVEITTSSVVEMTTAIREIASSTDELNGPTDSTVAALGLLRNAVKEVEDNARGTRSRPERTLEQAERGQPRRQTKIPGMQATRQR